MIPNSSSDPTLNHSIHLVPDTIPGMVPNQRPSGEHLSEEHLSEEQMIDLLLASPGIVQQQNVQQQSVQQQSHLQSCERCAAEVNSLRESLSLFQTASNAYADRELQSVPPRQLPSRQVQAIHPFLKPAYLLAAAAMLVTAILPLQMHHRSAPASPSAVTSSAPVYTPESDEALLEGIDRDLSASVPAPMQALAGPAVDVSSTSVQTSLSTPAQRNE